MIKAVLFDMDGTLLDLNLEAYIYKYNSKRSSLLADAAHRSKYSLLKPTLAAYNAIDSKSRTDDLTNEELFDKVFYEKCGIPLQDPFYKDLLRYFDLDVASKFYKFPINAHPRPGGFEALEKARELGMKVVLATNPTFSKDTIYVRMKWGGLTPEMFDHITYMSNSTRLKPSPRYFTEVAHAIGVEPWECLMVGNDEKRDITAPSLGMQTIYVGHKNPRDALWSCDMRDLSSLLPYLIDQVNLKCRKDTEDTPS